MNDIDTATMFGIPVAKVTLDEAVRLSERHIEDESTLQIGVINAAKVVKMQRDEFLSQSVLSSDIILADGSSIVAAARLLGNPLPERVAGIDLMHALLESANRNRYRVFLLGASEAISAKVENWVKETHPDVIVCGRADGYFEADDEEALVERIKTSNPDILFVAITSPKKEIFMARWGDELGATLMHGVGGSFDVVAGKVKRAPMIFQKLGMEWFYRLAQEPRRLAWRYISTNTRFAVMLLREMLSGKRVNDRGHES